MFRKGTIIDKKKPVNVILADGGMGDQVCALVAVNYLVNNCPWLDPYIWVPDYFIDFARHLIPNAKIDGYTAGKANYNEKLAAITTAWKSNHTAMRTHPVDYAFHILVDKHEYDLNQKNYLKIRPEEIDITKFNLPENYAVLSPLSVEKVKRMNPDVVNQISDYLNHKGITPVYVGSHKITTGTCDIIAETAGADFSKGINLVNATSLLETTAIMSKAKAFIGMDGGPLHLAGCTNVPIVVAYTFINPQHNMPIRNGILGYDTYEITPDESLGCRFCQTNWSMMYGFDYRNCLYKDYKCAKQITFSKFKVELDKIL